ncbi:MAG: F0F1 ATP synthase subunit A, partial [Flavisolibacter sp.]
MMIGRVKSLLVAAFSLFCLNSAAQEKEDGNGHIDGQHQEELNKETTKKFDANEVIFGHVLDAHQFHFFTYKDDAGHPHHVGIPLPVILYAPEMGGLHVFSASKFHHGEEAYKGFYLVNEEYRQKLLKSGYYSKEEIKGLRNETIVAIDEQGRPLKEVKVYDFSLTRNVVQMFLALALLVWILIAAAKSYSRAPGTKAPRGMQNAIEVLVTF